ncbi:MAG TPA: universal stress protein [Opitutaceae bacterium]|nr:universal stress protein [Opitutaceae bacterium]
MYRKILVALENGAADETLIPHITKFAKLVHAEVLLLHVADGWAARNFEQLSLAESAEMRADREYLSKIAGTMTAGGLAVHTELALGNPPQEIVRVAAERGCDLIAMTSHGHKLVGDILHGSTIDKVRHNTSVPLLVVRAGTQA